MDALEVRIPGGEEGMDEQEWHVGTLKYRGSTAEEVGVASILVEAKVAELAAPWQTTVGVSMHRCFCGEFGAL